MPSAEGSSVVRKVWTVDGRPRETLEILNQHKPSNLPGKVIVVVLLSLVPGGATPPHTHGNNMITGLMLQGKLLNQFNDEPPKTYGVGHAWFEPPGVHHVRSENVGDEVVKVYAVAIVDEELLEKYGPDAMMLLDADEEEKMEKEKEKEKKVEVKLETKEETKEEHHAGGGGGGGGIGSLISGVV